MSRAHKAAGHRIEILCLGCGAARSVHALAALRGEALDLCPQCGYVGWAPAAEISDEERRLLRSIPVVERGRRGRTGARPEPGISGALAGRLRLPFETGSPPASGILRGSQSQRL